MDIDKLKEALSYNPATGEFHWKEYRRGVRRSLHAGAIDRKGYRQLVIDGNRYAAHRLAWAFFHGGWPALHIDHINRDPLDNRIDNLRLATQADNMANMVGRAKSGYKGVYLHPRTGKWQAQIMRNRKKISLGYYSSAELASAAYTAAAEVLHGEFAPYKF